MSGSPTDFSDRLSPVLVKELRHGLRTRAFIAFFLILQGLLILTLLGDLGEAFGSSTSPHARSASSGVFWFFIGATLLYFLPMRGFSAISTEIKSNTLELIFLSHLTAWRIVTGKWISLVAQTSLFVCAVLPYMLLRYFIGGINLVEDLQILLTMFLASAILTAFSVAVSAFNSRVATVFFGFTGIFFLMSFGVFLTQFGRRGASPFGGSPEEFYLMFLGFGTMFLLTMLIAGASKIAPPAENFAQWKRIMALLAMSIATVFLAFNVATDFSFAVAVLLAFFICFFSLGEEVHFIPSICKPFVRYGWPGQLAGRFFYPGWPSGVRFTLLIGLILSLAMGFSGEEIGKMFVFVFGLLASLLMPLAILMILPARFELRVSSYYVFQIGLITASFVFLIIGDAMNFMKEIFELILPHTTVLREIFNNSAGDSEVAIIYYAFLTLASMVILFTKMHTTEGKLRETEKIARAQWEAEKASLIPSGERTL